MVIDSKVLFYRPPANFMRVAVVTGANRGIGNFWTSKLIDDGWKVYAGFRNNLDGLEVIENKNLITVQLDVTDNDSIANFSSKIEEDIDLLINNAGVPDGRWRSIEEIDDEWALEVINTNSLGPVRMVRSLYPKLKGENLTKIIMISSLMGSIDDCKMGRSYAYRASKTALNMFAVSMKKECFDDNISFLILHPGWVKTRMGGDRAPVELEDSVKGMMHLVEHHTLDDSGRFLSFNGEEINW